MSQEHWTAEQCAAHAGITTSTWRDYVADGRAPAPLPGYDPDTGRKTWDPATVRTWQAHRPGQGTRTDLTYHPDPAGHPVFLNAITLTAATLLRDLTTAHATTITRSTLPTHWTTQFPHHPTPSPRQIKKALNALHQLGALHHNRHHITITNPTLLDHIANLFKNQPTTTNDTQRKPVITPTR